MSQSVKDYLKVIYKLQRKHRPVTASDLAPARKVSPASTTQMVKRLAEKRLVLYTSYRGVELKSAGKKIAPRLTRLHPLLELYLKEALGYSWDRVHEEAGKLEDHISPEFEERIFEMLGHPLSTLTVIPFPAKRERWTRPSSRLFQRLMWATPSSSTASSTATPNCYAI